MTTLTGGSRCRAPGGSMLLAKAHAMAVRSTARKRLLDPAAASLAMNVSWEYAAAAQPLVVHERNVEGTYLQPAYFWSPVYSAPDVGSAAITDEQLLSTLQPPTAGASDPSHAHRPLTVPRHQELRQAAVILGRAVARCEDAARILLMGYGLSHLVRPAIVKLSAGVVQHKMKQLLDEMHAAAKAGVGDVLSGLQQAGAAAASVADTAAAVLLETLMVPVLWACHVLQCLITLLDVHTGMLHGAGAKCTLRRFLSGIAAL